MNNAQKPDSGAVLALIFHISSFAFFLFSFCHVHITLFVFHHQVNEKGENRPNVALDGTNSCDLKE